MIYCSQFEQKECRKNECVIIRPYKINRRRDQEEVVRIFCWTNLYRIIHLKIWTPNKPDVNTFKNNCSCSCFDTVFKGSYEKYPSKKYKHVYFNATGTTLAIWFITVITILVTYETIKSLLKTFQQRTLRKGMLFLLVTSIHSHYYSWWCYFNYFNDGFNKYFYHQMPFSFSELASSGMVLHLCNTRHSISPWKILWIVTINLSHIIVAGLDQFVMNVIFMKGFNYLIARDIGLMVPDILHVVVPCSVLWKTTRQPIFKMFARKDVLLSVTYLSVFTIISKLSPS